METETASVGPSVGLNVTDTITMETKPQSTNKYMSNLNDNLNIPHVVNPTYICQQQFTHCGHISNLQERQQCESFWSNVCQQK